LNDVLEIGARMVFLPGAPMAFARRSRVLAAEQGRAEKAGGKAVAAEY